MPKPSALLRELTAKTEAKYLALFFRKMDMLRQMCIDAAFMAAADVFQMGPGRCEAFGTALADYINEMARLMVRDARDDPEMEYAKEKVDRRLQKICGEKFDPWEARYEEGMGGLDHLLELAQAEKDGRIVKYLPGDTVYDRFGREWTVTSSEIHGYEDGSLQHLYRCGHPGTDDYCALCADEILTRAEAEAALERRKEEAT